MRGPHGKVLKTTTTKDGYLRVQVGKRKHLVHRLVLETFTGPCPEGSEGSHEDGDPENNSISNLMWRTKSSNCERKTIHGTNFTRGNTKLTAEEVASIRMRASLGESISSIARDSFSHLSRSTISHAARGRNWK